MEMTISEKVGPVTVLHMTGVLDGSTYQSLIDEAQKLYDGGVRDLLLDLSGLTFMSSAGISALYRVALIFRGEKQSGMEEGWASYHAISRERDSGVQKHVKLLKPIEKVQHALDLVGFNNYFEIYADEEQAVASFK